MKRGEIYFVDLSGTIGSEVNKVRPCIVVQNNTGNTFGNTTVVIPISHKSRKLLPTQMVVESDMFVNGFELVDGVAQCEQIRTVDKSRVSNYIGTLKPSAMEKLNTAILRSLGILSL